MNPQAQTLEEISLILKQLRSDPRSRRRFPNELWCSIIHLTQTYSIKEICQHLKIHPVYLREKMRSVNTQQSQNLDFQEIIVSNSGIPSGSVTIELFSSAGLKAKIQGPVSSLNFLTSLFKE